VARACRRRSEHFAKRWKWKGFGFTVLNAASVFKTLRAAADADRNGWADISPEYEARSLDGGGLDLRRKRLCWQIVDGSGAQVRKYVSPEERLKNMGQLLLDGTIDPEDMLPDID